MGVTLVKHNIHIHHTKIDAVFNKDTVNERVKPTAYRHGIRLQMAESGHEDEHANLLGDEGLRAAGQVLKLGYLYHSNYPIPFLCFLLLHLEVFYKYPYTQTISVFRIKS
jgi:hypothetical protein